jgi:hypothetical protein
MKYSLLLFVSSLAATTVMAAEAPTPGTGGHLAAASSLVKAPASRYERIQVSSEGASLVRDGESSPLRKGVTLTDGTIVAPNGEILRADGSPVTLRAGEWLDLDGQVCSPEHAPAHRQSLFLELQGSLDQFGEFDCRIGRERRRGIMLVHKSEGVGS